MGDRHATQNKYEHPSVTVDVAIFQLFKSSLNILLIQRNESPYQGRWAFPGGFINMDESLEEAALREVREETSVSGIKLEQLHTFGDPSRDPRGRVISVAYLALVPPDAIAVKAGDDAADVRWFPVNEVPDLAFDHPLIFETALQHLRSQTEYGDAAFKLLSHEFTLSQLQSAYEVLLGVRLDKRNFRRKIIHANILRAMSRTRTGEGRPAQLFSYVERINLTQRPRLIIP